MIEISIVVPVYNSENIIAELNSQVAHAMAGKSYELILVNDKSADRSWDKIVELASGGKHIIGISLRKNSGQDNAIMAGLAHAHGEFVVIMDDDLQHAPQDINKLHEKCKAGVDVCYGVFKDTQYPLWKKLGGWLNSYLAELFLKKPKGLYMSAFKIIRGSVVKDIIQYNGPFPYVDGIIFSIASNIAQIELAHQKRFDGKGTYGLVKSISVFLKHVTGYSLYPLRIATIIGVMASGLSFLLGTGFIIDYLANDAHVEGWITLVLLIVFFNGLMLMCLGLIGEYVGRIYLTVTDGRQYVVERVVGDLDT
jgi:polyisoprenyl-phosphate glycosyltransferase